MIAGDRLIQLDALDKDASGFRRVRDGRQTPLVQRRDAAPAQLG
jgi:hypothetical protein